MGHGTYEREEVLALSLLSAMAGESIFMLGLPGVGKSMIARRLKMAFEDARVFEYLMSRFSTPDEVFGPVSISKLKDEDCYERVTAGYLPEAEVIFLDEIWKAGPAIQNSLLTVLNEKIFLNGNREMHLPVKAIIAASNELPAEGEGLEALWDRFLIRYIVEPLQSKDKFARLLKGDGERYEMPKYKPLTPEEYFEVQNLAAKVVVPDELVGIMFDIRGRLNSKTADDDQGSGKFYISDRRWKKAVKVMRMSACLNGRKSVDMSDLLLLSHMLWNDDGTIDEVSAVIAERLVAGKFGALLDANKSSRRHVQAGKGSDELFSIDGVHYMVKCDGVTLRIRIRDYDMLAKSGDLVYASETTDERLVLNANGSLSLRVIKPGTLNINSYNYPLLTVNDREMSEQFLSEMGDTLEDLMCGLARQISENMFVTNGRVAARVNEATRVYVDRIRRGLV